MVSLIASYLITGRDMAKVKVLSHARAEFERLVPENAGRFGKVYAMFLGEGSAAYYPIGSRSRRYMIGSAGNQGELMAESFSHGKVRVEWSLPLVQAKPGSKPKGTLQILLRGFNLAIGTTHLTKAELAALKSVQPLVAYSFHPIRGYAVAYFRSDGKETSRDTYEPESNFSKAVPICDDEAEAAGLGDKGWDAGGKHNPNSGG